MSEMYATLTLLSHFTSHTTHYEMSPSMSPTWHEDCSDHGCHFHIHGNGGLCISQSSCAMFCQLVNETTSQATELTPVKAKWDAEAEGIVHSIWVSRRIAPSDTQFLLSVNWRRRIFPMLWR